MKVTLRAITILTVASCGAMGSMSLAAGRGGPGPRPAVCRQAQDRLEAAEHYANSLAWVTNSAQLGPYCHSDYNCIVSWQRRYNQGQVNLQLAQQRYNQSCR